MIFFKKAIEDMAACSLRCVAIAYRPYETEKVPTNEEQLARWVLPEDDLVLLAIVGLKVIQVARKKTVEGSRYGLELLYMKKNVS